MNHNFCEYFLSYSLFTTKNLIQEVEKQLEARREERHNLSLQTFAFAKK